MVDEGKNERTVDWLMSVYIVGRWIKNGWM